jgi:hypothetical protein
MNRGAVNHGNLHKHNYNTKEFLDGVMVYGSEFDTYSEMQIDFCLCFWPEQY